MVRLAALTILLNLRFAVFAAEGWQPALSQMPLPAGVRELNRTNCVEVVLRSFQSNQVVKGLVFMPGATDEFYMFRRAKAQLAEGSSTLLEAITALTNQTLIRVTFRAPLLLLHTDEDPLEPLIEVQNEAAAAKLRGMRFVPHALYNDRDWDYLQPILQKTLKAEVRPWRHMYDSWHFYRHSFAGWNLNGWEAMEAAALAGKTRITIRRKRGISFRPILLVFEGDERVRATPKVEGFIR
jgi:hypothetical protein